MNTFHECVQYVKQLPSNNGNIDQATQLHLYGLYKVATQGEAPLKQPKGGLTERHKHQAWKDASLTCFSQEHAKQEYVTTLNQIVTNFK